MANRDHSADSARNCAVYPPDSMFLPPISGAAHAAQPEHRAIHRWRPRAASIRPAVAAS